MNYNETGQEAPPIGVMPRDFWLKLRLNDLSRAIKEYLDTGNEVPTEWYSEANNINRELEKLLKPTPEFRYQQNAPITNNQLLNVLASLSDDRLDDIAIAESLRTGNQFKVGFRVTGEGHALGKGHLILFVEDV